MALAPAIPWDWDYEANVASSNVLPVINEFNGLTDLAFTSIKGGERGRSCEPVKDGLAAGRPGGESIPFRTNA